jgi:O-antigen/teichoic acid export membrane protein
VWVVASEGVGADSVSRNAAFAVVTRLTTAAITALVAIFLGRKLGPQVYGYFALAMSIGTVCAFLADLGITSGTPRFIAERRHNRAAVSAVVGDAMRLKAFAAVPVSVLLFALAGPITNAFDTPGAEWPLRGIAIAVLAQGFFMFVLATFEAVGRIAINLRVVALESVIEGTSIVALVLLGAGATGAAFGRAIGYTVGAGIALGFVLSVVGRPRAGAGHVSGLRPRDIARYAGALLIVDALFRAFAQIDVLLIGAILGGGRAIGLFDLPMQLAWFLHYPAGAVSSAVAPRLARGPGLEPQIGTFMDAMRWITALQGIFLAPILVWAEPIMTTLLGNEYRESGEVLRALTPFILLSGPALLVSGTVNYLGAARKRVPFAIAALAVNATFDAIFLPRMGIVAGAIGTDLAYAIWVPAHVVIVHQLLGVALRPLVLNFVHAALAAGVACLPLLALGADPGVVILVLGSALACLVYVVTLRLTGGVGPADIERMREIVGRRIGWMAPR